MVLDSLGIQIGPLLAGAGVVGIAIGFGAQTLVKDIISGMFYLLDDAFRVGEYIQAGSHKGTVESFSLRSIKLRHHRGPIATVPFGELGAVQNLSRDWVIDKITIGVTYDTDLDKVKKLVKQIGKELHGRSGVRPAHHRAAEDAGRRADGRLRHPDPAEDDDQARRAVRHPPPGLCADQEGLRGQRHQVRLPDGAGRRDRATRPPPQRRPPIELQQACETHRGAAGARRRRRLAPERVRCAAGRPSALRPACSVAGRDRAFAASARKAVRASSRM